MKYLWFSHEKEAEEAHMNIFAFPYVGGSPSFYAPWKRLIPEGVGWYPVLYPGREGRKEEIITENLFEMVDQIIEDNRELFLSAPVVLMGHCTGTILAYECARVLKKRLGIDPAYVVLSSSLDPVQSTEILLKEIVPKQGESEEDVIVEFLTSHKMIPEMLMNMEGFQEYFLPIYVKDLKMFMNYKSPGKEKVASDALIMFGDQDTMIDRETIEDWKDWFSGNVTVLERPGDHYFINNCKPEVLSLITQAVEKGGGSI